MDDRLKSKATNERVKGRIAEVDNEGERRERKERKEVDGPSDQSPPHCIAAAMTFLLHATRGLWVNKDLKTG